MNPMFVGGGAGVEPSMSIRVGFVADAAGGDTVCAGAATGAAWKSAKSSSKNMSDLYVINF